MITQPESAPFEIIRELGRGGVGVVYLARERASGQMAALKVLAPRVAKEPAFVKRFLREARTAAQLSRVWDLRPLDF